MLFFIRKNTSETNWSIIELRFTDHLSMLAQRPLGAPEGTCPCCMLFELSVYGYHLKRKGTWITNIFKIIAEFFSGPPAFLVSGLISMI